MHKETNSLGINKMLELVFKYLAKVSLLKDYNEILEVLAQMGKVLANAERCSIWIVSEDKKTIWTKVSQGIDKIEMPISLGIVGDAIVSDRKELITDVALDARFNKAIDEETGYKTESMMVIPMSDNNSKIIGALQVVNHKDDTFTSKDMELLTLASTYVTRTLMAVQLAIETEATQKELVFIMGSIAENRSNETSNHVRRVAEYSKILAIAYGLEENEAELLKEASPMHDIGKIAMPDNILNKPGRFDENERFIMQRHSELGYEMIKDSQRPLLKVAAIIAREHHEKWDGTGYPRGIYGDNIHIYGRITAIADVFDALGSDRIYKKAWSDEKIFELLHKERGKHFDPYLVNLFFENLEQIKRVREKFKDIYVEKKVMHNNMQITILGAYGTKSKGYGTSAFLLNKKNVIDAGNLLEPLNIESIDIENIWMTHSHLDHIIDIAYILDNYFNLRKKSLNIIGLPETIKAIKENFLNNTIWPDFSKIPLTLSKEMAVTYTEIEVGREYKIGNDEYIKAFLTDHTVASCGYVYTKKNSAVIITADTYSLQSMIKEIEKNKKIKTMVVECSFPNSLKELAYNSKHLTPEILFRQLKALKRENISLCINHIKPSFYQKIRDEIECSRGEWDVKILKDGFYINF